MRSAASSSPKGRQPPDILLSEAERRGIPLLRTHHHQFTFISLMTQFLEERLLPQTTIHGVLVDVLGVGVLLIGKSGIGKSECALDLVLRGHRLVADDVVKVRLKFPAVLFGEGRICSITTWRFAAWGSSISSICSAWRRFVSARRSIW